MYGYFNVLKRVAPSSLKFSPEAYQETQLETHVDL